MWLSEKIAGQHHAEQAAADGVVSVGGEKPAVVTDAERRDFIVVSPGGYQWQPDVSQRVVILCEPGRVLGAEQSVSGLEPGEVRIFSRGASIRLGNDGSIRLDGTVYINGERWVPSEFGTA